MPYTKTVWKDRVVEKPMTYTLRDNGDGTHTLISAEGTLIDPGTPINATIMNNLESQYEQAVAESLPRVGGALTGALTSDSDISTTANISGTNGTFTGAIQSASLTVSGASVVDAELTVKGLSMKASDNDVKNIILARADGSTTTNNGFGIGIGAGGTTVIGGGESPQNVLVSTLIADTSSEKMYVVSDNDIEFMMGMQNVGTDPTVGKRIKFATNGDINFGGNNVDGNVCALSYSTATKTATLKHWSGTASTDDVTLTVNKVEQTGASQGDVLWSSTGQYMTAGQVVTPSKSLDQCANGWQLIWSDYDAGVGSNNFQITSTFIHKSQIAGNTLHMLPVYPGDDTVSGRFCVKDLSNTRTQITGSANNDGLNDVALRQVLSY